MELCIPEHIITAVNAGCGSSFKNAIRINPDDSDSFVELEYNIINFHSSLNGYKYKVLEQLLIISRNHNVYDVITIQMKDCSEKRFWFNITDVFGSKNPEKS